MKVKKNENRELVVEIESKLKETDGYCPCRIAHNQDTKCMCKEFRDQIKAGESGECHCGLYIYE